MEEAARFGMDALVEVHDEAEMERAAELGARLIGINNRNLKTFVTDLNVTQRLAPRAPRDAHLVAESGLSAPADLKRLAQVACHVRADRRKPDAAEGRRSGDTAASGRRLPAMSKLSHLDDKGAAHMVDVSAKAVTAREASAEATVTLSADAFAAVMDGTAPKGDVLAAARIAGIMAAKKVPDLIPLCHPLAITRAAIEFDAGRGASRHPSSSPPSPPAARPAWRWRRSPPLPSRR